MGLLRILVTCCCHFCFGVVVVMDNGGWDYSKAGHYGNIYFPVCLFHYICHHVIANYGGIGYSRYYQIGHLKDYKPIGDALSKLNVPENFPELKDAEKKAASFWKEHNYKPKKSHTENFLDPVDPTKDVEWEYFECSKDRYELIAHICNKKKKLIEAKSDTINQEIEEYQRLAGEHLQKRDGIKDDNEDERRINKLCFKK